MLARWFCRVLWAWGVVFGLVLSFSTAAFAREVRVCVRPPGVPANVERWAILGTGKILVADLAEFERSTEGYTVYIFDPAAPPQSAQSFPYWKFGKLNLKCPPRVLPPAVLPPKKDAPAKKAEEPKKPEPSKPGPTKPEPKKPEPRNVEAPTVAPKAGLTDEGEAPKPNPNPASEPPQTDLRHLRWDVPPTKEAQVTQCAVEEPQTSVLPTVRKSSRPTPMTGLCGDCTEQRRHLNGDPPEEEAEPKSIPEEVAEQLALLGSALNAQMDDIHRPDGKRYGIPCGLNPNGPNHPALQAAAGAVGVAAAVLSATGKLDKLLRSAIEKGKPLILMEAGAIDSATAKELAGRYLPGEVADAMAKNGTIAPYSSMREITDGLGHRWEAHHIFEDAKMLEQGFSAADRAAAPSVILTAEEHKKLHEVLAKEAARVAKATTATAKEKLWLVYQEVYKKNPHWLNAIRSYFVDK